MGGDQLLDFIQNSRSKGRSDEQIRRALLAVGWKKERVDAALKQAAEPEKAPALAEASAQQESTPAQPSQAVQQQPAAMPAQVLQPSQPAQQQTEKPAGIPVQPPSQEEKPGRQPSPQAISPPAVKSPPWVSQTAASPKPSALPGQQPPSEAQAALPAPAQPTIQAEAQPQTEPPGQKTKDQKKPFLPFQSLFARKTAVQPPAGQPGASIASKPAQAQQQPALEPAASQPQQQAPEAQTEGQQAQPPQTTAPHESNPAFSNISSLPKMPQKRNALLAAAAAIILLVAGAYYVFVIGANGGAPSASPAQPTQGPVLPDAAPLQNQSIPSDASQQSPSGGDCGADFNCFIQNALSCSHAKVEFSSAADLFGIVTSTSSDLQIKGKSGGRCQFYIKNRKIEVRFSNQTVQQMLQNGLTAAQISASERQATAQAQSGAGLDGTCLFEQSDLDSMLLRWKSGSFSSGDYGAAECTGPMFQQAPLALPPPAYPAPILPSPVLPESPGVAEAPPVPAPAPAEPQEQQPIRFKKFTSSGPYSPSAFCKKEGNGTLFQIHYKQYWGSGCTSEKGSEGFINGTGMPSKCELVPCCFYAPFSEYSTLYDYFECGYYSYD